MCHIDDDADLVHLRNGRVTEVTQATVVRFSGTIAERVPPVVGQVHHAGAEFVEDADVAQFIAYAFPVLYEGYTVGCEADTDVSCLF